MILNKHLLKINRNLLVCSLSSQASSTVAAQLLAGYDNYINTTVAVAIGYLAFFAVFSSLFYLDNRVRHRGMEPKLVRKELFDVISALVVGEIIFFVIRWSTHYYFLEIGIEPYLTSIVSHVVSMIVFQVVVTAFLKKKKTF
ncbi:MAG: hypothetical protein F4Y18_05275 [Cenarchaeum sp. SB0663_bin_5]|nr:hypothetical protein [Cenarchaeum sp. SB0663_bin_5]MYH04673.1 hypothetical protein [Cenarchaeum sp. SB0675_bin_21]